MRVTLSRFTAFGVMLAQLVAAPLAEAAPCARPADQAAFSAAGMKSEMMVVALQCNGRDKYNAFVTHYQPDLQMQDRALNAYFTHVYGRRWQTVHDDYITQLANAQSDAAIKQGTYFCRQNIGLLDEVMNLPTGWNMINYAERKNFVQPWAVPVCGAPAPRARVASVSK